MIAAVDRWIIEHVYQRAVDASQRGPAWWAEQCGYAYGVVSFTRVIILSVGQGFGWYACLLVVLALVTAAAMVLASRMGPLALERLASRPWRAVWAGLFAFDVIALLNGVDDGELPAAARSLVFLSFAYFAACEPPRPRHRTRMASAGGAA